MKRVVLAVMSVAVFAGVASGQHTTGTVEVWLQNPDGGNTINLLVSETGIIQLWMDYTAPSDGVWRHLVGGDAGLQQRPVAPDESIEVVDFNDYGPWGLNDTFYRYSRGQLDEAPHDGTPDYTGVGNINNYMFISNVDTPYTTSNGLLPGGGNMLLDEIIIEGIYLNDVPDKVFFTLGLQAPSWFESYYDTGSFKIEVLEFTASLGTGSGKTNPVYVNVVPEPGTLALLAFGGLAVIRRRR